MADHIRITDGFEEVKLTEPRKALDQAGTDTRVVSPKGDEVHGAALMKRGGVSPHDA
jgi:protease I